MPAVLKFNAPAIRDVIGQAAKYLDIDGGFDGFCGFVDDFNALFQVPRNLGELGISNPDIDRIVAGALKDPSTGGNPVEMTEENTRKLLLQIV